MRFRALLTAAWSYRGFIATSVVNEFRTRLARSKLGVAWLVLHPLAQVVVFAAILSKVLAARLEGMDNSYAYAVYLLAGIACWSLFSEVVLRCTTVFVDQASLLRKMNFPRITLPVVVIGSALVANACLILVLVAAALLLGFDVSWAWAWLPVMMLLTTALAAGIGLLLGTLHVFARDVGQVIAVVLQFWFWATPIVYPATIVPEGFKRILSLNPVAPLVKAYQDVILHARAPDGTIWFTVVVAAGFLLLALFIFRRASAELVDAL
jgi:lipopolysaccharide transport system permease protein